MSSSYESQAIDPESSDSEDLSPPRRKSIAKIAGLTGLFFFLLVIFTVLKLPQVRITSLLQGYLQVALDPYGIYLTDRGRELSMIRGFRYSLDHPVLEFADQTRVELDDMVVSPKLISLITGKMGATITLHQGATSITLDGSGKGDKIDAKLDLDHADVGKLGVLAYAANLKGSGDITGSAKLSGTLSDPTSLSGGMDFKLKKLKIDEAKVMGLQLPPLLISEGTLNIDIRDGKLIFKTVQFGKGSDDLILSVSGDITLNRFFNGSNLNLKTVFALSDRLKQSLSFLDSIIGAAKTADGKYAYKLTGTIGAPIPNPDPSSGK